MVSTAIANATLAVGILRLIGRLCSRANPFSVRLLLGDSAHPPLFGQPARPDHGAWALRSVPSGAPPWNIRAAFWYGVVGRETPLRWPWRRRGFRDAPSGLRWGAPAVEVARTGAGRIPDFPEQCVGKDGL